MSLARNVGTIGGLTLLSRVLGLVRDSLFARFIGASFASDAFLVAFRLPNMFRALFAEGAFASAFIPLFNQKVADPEGAGLLDGISFAERALAVLLPVLIVMTVVLEVLAWPVTLALSGKFNGVSHQQFAFAVALSRITIPYLLLISLVSLFGGILNSLHKFWVNAAAPILLNLTLIVALLGFHSHDPLVTAMETQNRGLELALLLTLPATVGLVFCGEPIAAALFGYGRYDAADTHYTAQSLAAFSVGLPSYILVKVLTPGFYARQDTRTPVRYAMISMVVNLALNLALIVPLKHMGPPLATAIASSVNVWMLYATLRRRGHFEPDARLRRRAWRLVLAALAMGVVIWLLQPLLMPYVHGTWVLRIAAMAVLVGAGALVYAAATFALGAFSRDDLQFLRRRRAS